MIDKYISGYIEFDRHSSLLIKSNILGKRLIHTLTKVAFKKVNKQHIIRVSNMIL